MIVHRFASVVVVWDSYDAHSWPIRSVEHDPQPRDSSGELPFGDYSENPAGLMPSLSQ